MNKVRIGVAGANGAFGSKHLDALSQIDNVEIVAAMATTLEKANGVADKYSIPNRFDNYDDMLEIGRSRRCHLGDTYPNTRRTGSESNGFWQARTH
jgi:hypothetical protein